MKNFIVVAVVVGMLSFASNAHAGVLRCLAGKVLSPVRAVVKAQPVRSVVRKRPVRATVGRVWSGCRNGVCGR